jgi:hypothetical protein
MTAIDPLHDLYDIHCKREKHLEAMEKRLEEEDAPVSLHVLYRGVLKDYEAACYKMLAMQQQGSGQPVECAPLSSGKKASPSNSMSILALLLGLILSLVSASPLSAQSSSCCLTSSDDPLRRDHAALIDCHEGHVPMHTGISRPAPDDPGTSCLHFLSPA